MKRKVVCCARRLLGVLAAFMVVAAGAQSLEVIDLKYRTAQEVMPLLQPLVESGGALSGSDYKLFVRASAANVAQLRRALLEIDRAPRQLFVSVRRASRETIEREALASTATVGTHGAAASISTADAAVHGDENSIAGVHVLEGSSAYIATGQRVPVVTAMATGGRRPWLAASTTYRDVDSGFLVTPRVSGSRVTLSIEQHAQRQGASDDAVDMQRIATQVSGELGRWIALGGVRDASNHRADEMAAHRYATRSDDLEVWVKVETRQAR